MDVDDASPADQYPEFYGGSYVNEAGEMVILITEDSDGLPAVQQEAVEAASSMTYHVETVTYSYRELREAMEAINSVLREDDRPEIAAEIQSIRILDDRNEVLIRLQDDSEENIEAFRRDVHDAPFLVFAEGSESTEY